MCVAIYILHPESIQIPSHFALDLVSMDKSALVFMFALWQCGWWNLTHMGLLFRNCPIHSFCHIWTPIKVN